MTLETWALCRVSTDKDQSPASQKATIERWCAEQNPPVPVDVWIGDQEGEHISGGAEERPDLDRILAAAEEDPPRLGRLIVSSVERIGRLGPLTSLYIEGLAAHGVEVIGVQQGGTQDLLTPKGRLISRVMFAVSAYFREELSPKTKAGFTKDPARVPEAVRVHPAGVTVAVRSGKRVGRPGAFFAPETYAEVLAARAKGWTWERIAGAFTASRRRWMADAPEVDGTPSDSGRWEIVNSIALDAKGARLAFRRTVPG